MNCRELKEKIGAGEKTEEVSAHITDCVDCAALVEEEGRLSGLLRELEPVEVPGDFNTVVRSKLAEKRGLGSVLGWARILVPAAAMCFIIAAVAFNSDLFVEGNDTPRVELQTEGDSVTSPPNAPMVDVRGPNSSPGTLGPKEAAPLPEDIALGIKDPEPMVEKGPAEPVVPAPEREDEPILSKDLGVEKADVEVPEGLDKRSVPNKPVQNKTFGFDEILKTLGAASEWRGKSLFVTSVAKDSLAEKSGLKTGDRVVAIDGKTVSKRPFSMGSVKGVSLRVVRKGRVYRLSTSN